MAGSNDRLRRLANDYLICNITPEIRELLRELLVAREKLAALDWTPITAGNLPKGPSGDYAGDEIWWYGYGNPDCAGPEIIHATSGHNYKDADSWLGNGYTHRRPINPPQEPK